MKTYNLPVKCAAILFDMDSTLYSHPEYARSQIDLPIERLANMRGISFSRMNEEITRYRANWAKEHNGQGVSLGNIFKAFGISINESVKWREELYSPEQYLSRDMLLRRALEQLNSEFTLGVVTNNPVSIAGRTLYALGVDDLFNTVIGLDTCGVSKPHREPFLRAAALCGASPGGCVSVGDRYDIDIALPLELGMGGILVDGVEDVYRLPELFIKSASENPDQVFGRSLYGYGVLCQGVS
ncbi:MAG: HAD family hydrolase [Treponema sp.]|jgi:phosphoglycolate phosphatase/putative hydrolase of the HAD superfamily|nr:HAD family hydrolase [Treponema sp.]